MTNSLNGYFFFHSLVLPLFPNGSFFPTSHIKLMVESGLSFCVSRLMGRGVSHQGPHHLPGAGRAMIYRWGGGGGQWVCLPLDTDSKKLN